MAPVDEHQELDAGGAAVIEKGVERRTNSAARIEHVVHKYNVFADDVEADLPRIDNRAFRDGGQIVAIEIDVEDADRNFAVFETLDFGGETLRERNTAALNADKSKTVEVGCFFEDFVGETDEGPVDFGSAHELSFFADSGHAEVWR